MALEGTLRDFSLADILQLISLQKKTGLLTLKNPDDTLTIGFADGMLVSAESSAKRIDTRLGSLLVKTRRLSPEHLQKALEIQGQTLQRLGFILLKGGYCTTEDLKAGLETQIRKIVFAAFRWTDAEYVFDPQERIDYDREFVVPVSVESLLMQGARMVDEWPIIEKVVRSGDLVYQRVPLGQAVIQSEDDAEMEDFGESTFERKAREHRDEPIRISREEWAVYELVDGRRTVSAIIERTFLSEFEGTKAFYDLLSRGLIEEAKRLLLQGDTLSRSQSIEIPRPAALEIGGLSLGISAGLVVLLVASLLLASRNPLNVLTIPPRRLPALEAYQKSLSLVRLRRLGEAVDVFYLTQGRFPESVDAVAAARLLAPADLVDPWGHRYRYILQPDKGKYYLVGFDAEGKTDIDLLLSHHVIGGDGSGDSSVRTRSAKDVIILK